jgi:ATPase family protein associated with various cellular activities (AAA)
LQDLKDHLETLHALDEARKTAKKWQSRGLRALNGIATTTQAGRVVAVNDDSADGTYLRDWTCSGDDLEAALLASLRRYPSPDHAGDEGPPDAGDLLRRLERINLEQLLPRQLSSPGFTAEPVPVLLAARALQALASRSETVISKASLFCYYRIALELHNAVGPDWTIGAGRAGRGGRMSAFITSECTRGILAFERALARTSDFLRHTLTLYDGFLRLAAVLAGAGVDPASSHPLSTWANGAIERMWLDWYISTHPCKGSVALYNEGDNAQLLPLPPRAVQPREVTMATLAADFSTLRERIAGVARRARKIHVEVDNEIKGFPNRLIDGHARASQFIGRATQHAGDLESICMEGMERPAPESLRLLLANLLQRYGLFSAEIHVVLEPAKRFVRSVLDRELAIAHSGRPFDAGEMVFAATAYGISTNWQDNDKTAQACSLLAKALPESGRLGTNCPFHATVNGYKLLPIGCEMTSHFAQLLLHTRYPVDPALATRLLSIFLNDEQRFRSAIDDDDHARVGWNFENAPDATRPCVWVTAIAVMALDRIVRMLSGRINEIVFEHFKVIRPERPHISLTLNELLYPDHGLVSSHHCRSPLEEVPSSIAICLEKMRAHVTGASLPKKYREDATSGTADSAYSAILYGPPGTGKTTLLEALALSSKAPLVMLSPSDLIVQGEEQLEARAKAVFDALSMLSQVVILFDEFEPVLRRRGLGPHHGKPRPSGLEGQVLGVQDAIRESGASVLNFLLTGMLPKLGALHDAAEKQAFVYCLATNHLEEIDPAAKRKGRFDLQQPIYNPDPISRTGAFLFRLQPLASQLGKKSFLDDPATRAVLAAIITVTGNTSAGDLSRTLFNVPSLSKGSDDAYRFGERDRQWSFFAHVLEGASTDALETLRLRIEKSTGTSKTAGDALAEERYRLEKKEADQRAWLLAFEATLHQRLCRIEELSEGTTAAFLEALLLADFDLSGPYPNSGMAAVGDGTADSTPIGPPPMPS